MTARSLQPGRALELVEPAPLTADLSWARANPRIAEALARWVGTVERVAAPVIPGVARNLVRTQLSEWQGERPGLSRSWVEKAVEPLENEARAMARLILLLAKASYQIDDSVVLPVLEQGGQELLIKVLAWGAIQASRRLTSIVAEHQGATLAA